MECYSIYIFVVPSGVIYVKLKILFYVNSSEREYEETGSEGEQQEEIEGEEDIGPEEEIGEERLEDEQERDELDMMESHQRNHIGER